MSGRVPKKRDLFNGGRGIDLCDETSMDCQSFQDSTSPDLEDSQYRSDMGFSPAQEYTDDRYEESPTCSPTPIYSPSSPSNYYMKYQPEDSRERVSSPVQYMPPGNSMSIGPQPTCSSILAPQAIPAHVPAHLGGPPYTIRPIYAEPAYAQGVLYPALRPMDPNGLYAVGPHYEVGGPRMDPTQVVSHSSGDVPKKKKRQQNCSLCSNHDIQVEVKGHKWFCPYRDCKCDRCQITRGRQHHMKEQQKLTRDLKRKSDTK